MRWITWLLSYMYSQIFAFSNPISFHVIFVILRIQYWDFFSKSVPCKTIFIMPERNISFSCVYMSKQKISKQTEWNVQNVAVCLVFFFYSWTSIHFRTIFILLEIYHSHRESGKFPSTHFGSSNPFCIFKGS